jgi:thermitase
LKLSGTVLALYGLAGCGSTPGAVTPAPGIDPGPLASTTESAAPTAPTPAEASEKPAARETQRYGAKAVPGEIVVKLKKAMGIQSVPNMMRMESIEELGNTSVYKVPEGQSVEEALTKLRKDPNVIYAEPNYIYRATGVSAKRMVNDPKFNELWGMSKIEAPQAWDTTAGKSDILVAVIDTGVDYNHPDLQGQVVKGPDFGNNDADPMDDQGHGTHVAGTIAALGDNGKGVVGVAYNTKILAIKVLGSDGSGDMAAIAKGVLKAHEMGAKVINMSLGGEQDARTIKDAIDQVTAKGALVVVAAGNENTTRNTYPAAYPSVLSVGATDKSDRRPRSRTTAPTSTSPRRAPASSRPPRRITSRMTARRWPRRTPPASPPSCSPRRATSPRSS